MTNLEIRNAYKKFHSKENLKVLDNLHMKVEKGSIYALVGYSGCGKTTLISCVLGMVQLDKGEIYLFGNRTKHESRFRYARKVGYMPQEVALCRNLTVRETIYYFGLLHEMDDKLLSERSVEIMKLLNLQNENELISNCSGGEQRRVSLAASLIHDPTLIVLDEPTVGVDVILRHQIWEYLRKITRNSEKSIIITTHYTEEAQKSDCVGILRHGKIIMEKHPNKIMQICNSNSLEESILTLCSREVSYENSEEFQQPQLGETANNEIEDSSSSQVYDYNWKITKSILTKQMLIIKRHSEAVISILFVPMLLSYVIASGFGGKIQGMKLGIVNNEISDDCINFKFDTNLCYNRNISCIFLSELKANFDLIFYHHVDDLIKDAKDERLFGYMKIGEEFSRSFNYSDEDMKNENFNNTDIDTHIDNTNLMVGVQIKRIIYSAYFETCKQVAKSCQFSTKFCDNPIATVDTFGGSIEDDQSKSLFIGFLLQSTFIIVWVSFTTLIIEDRKESLWNRTLLSGVKMSHLLFSNSCMVFIVITIVNIEYSLSGYFLGIFEANGILQFFMFTSIFSFIGVIFGILMAFIFNDFAVFNSFLFFMILIESIISGIVWPIESFDPFMKFIAYFFSFALPIRSVINVMIKNLPISNPNVYQGILVVIFWIILMSYLIRKISSRNKFARNT